MNMLEAHCISNGFRRYAKCFDGLAGAILCTIWYNTPAVFQGHSQCSVLKILAVSSKTAGVSTI